MRKSLKPTGACEFVVIACCGAHLKTRRKTTNLTKIAIIGALLLTLFVKIAKWRASRSK